MKKIFNKYRRRYYLECTGIFEIWFKSKLWNTIINHQL